MSGIGGNNGGAVLRFNVEGLRCGNCSAKVVKALNGVDGVSSVEVDHAAGRGEVSFDPARTSGDQLLDAVNATGFPATAAE